MDVDMAFVLDSSESTTPFQFDEMKKYVGYLVRQLDLSPDPRASRRLARVAVVQHAPYASAGNSSEPPARVELSLTDYGSKDKLLDFLDSQVTQLQGTRSLGNAVEYTIENVFESAPHPRDLKIVVLMLTGELREPQLREARRAVLQAKCRGYFFVVLGIGGKVNVKDVFGLASEPHDVFFKLVDKPAELGEEPLLRFGRLLPSFVASKSWPPAARSRRRLPRAIGCGARGRGRGGGLGHREDVSCAGVHSFIHSTNAHPRQPSPPPLGAGGPRTHRRPLERSAKRARAPAAVGTVPLRAVGLGGSRGHYRARHHTPEKRVLRGPAGSASVGA